MPCRASPRPVTLVEAQAVRATGSRLPGLMIGIVAKGLGRRQKAAFEK